MYYKTEQTNRILLLLLFLLLLMFIEQEIRWWRRRRRKNNTKVNKMMRKEVKEWLSNGDTSSSEFLLCWSLICLLFVRFDWKQTWAIEWFVFLFSFSRKFFFLSFSFFSHTVSFFCQIRTSSCIFMLCTATKTTTTAMKTITIRTNTRFFSLSFLHTVTYIYIRFIRSPSGEEKRKKERKKRVAPFATTAIKFVHILFAILRFSNFLSSFVSFLPKWLEHRVKDLKRKYLQSKKKKKNKLFQVSLLFLLFPFVNHMVLVSLSLSLSLSLSPTYFIFFVTFFCQWKKFFNRKRTQDFFLFLKSTRNNIQTKSLRKKRKKTTLIFLRVWIKKHWICW